MFFRIESNFNLCLIDTPNVRQKHRSSPNNKLFHLTYFNVEISRKYNQLVP